MTCAQPGRGGTIQDGYRDTCGMALALARLTPDEDRGIELVDVASSKRPRTLT